MPESAFHTVPLAVVIPAGGGGTRLWPRSRRATPKQFIDIVTPGLSMLQETYSRVVPALVPSDHLFAITSQQHSDLVRTQLPDVPRLNVVGEPTPRDSAPAIGLMAALIEQQMGSDAVMIVLPSDHAIADQEAFRNCLREAAFIAESDYLVTIGIPPTGPDTGFGYIHRGPSLRTRSVTAFDVIRFQEKPDRATAAEYVASGDFYWNAGMYVAKVGTYRDLYRRLLPEMEETFAELVAVYGTQTQETTFARLFPQLTKVSFDYAISEKAERVAVVPAHIGWSDVGSWARLAEVLDQAADEKGNISLSGDLPHRLIDTTGSLIYAPDKLVATIGLSDVVIVDTPGALLIASKACSEDVKQIVEWLKEEGRLDLL